MAATGRVDCVMRERDQVDLVNDIPIIVSANGCRSIGRPIDSILSNALANFTLRVVKNEDNASSIRILVTTPVNPPSRNTICSTLSFELQYSTFIRRACISILECNNQPIARVTDDGIVVSSERIIFNIRMINYNVLYRFNIGVPVFGQPTFFSYGYTAINSFTQQIDLTPNNRNIVTRRDPVCNNISVTNNLANNQNSFVVNNNYLLGNDLLDDDLLDDIPDTNEDIQDICESGEFPQVFITARTDLLGSNLADITITVYDTIKYPGDYYCNPVIVCSNPNIYQTILSKYPKINKVLNAPGCTLNDIIESLLVRYNINLSYGEFFGKLMLYALSKYALAGLIYSDRYCKQDNFSVEILLRKNNKKFFTDLANSRFYRFLELYTDPEIGITDYDKYFIYDFDDYGNCDDCSDNRNIYGNNGNNDSCQIVIKSRST